MRTLRSRAGFTLVETLIAMVLFAIMIGAALTLFNVQVRTFEVGAERSELTIGGQFAAHTMAQQIRTAGTHMAAGQPWLVYAGENVIAFNSDYVSRIPDPFAVYIDPDVPTEQTVSLKYEDRFTLPQTGFVYPGATHFAAPGVLASGELILFYFEADTSTTRGDDYMLMRQVNSTTPELIAAGLLRSGSTPFFQYYEIGEAADSLDALIPIAGGTLPLMHSDPVHLSPTDAGTTARIDEVRAVRFTYTATNGRTGADERLLSRSDLIWMRNANLNLIKSCGTAPLFSSGLNATVIMQGSAPAVRLRWNPSTDEASGEQDVIRYVIWRTVPAGTMGDPFLSIPADGSGQYEYVDGDVQSGENWVYSIAAQDCTPTLSGVGSVPPVVIP